MVKIRFLFNALISLGLVVAFYFFFMTTKHDTALSQIIPFANDPYDAIGSFGLETAAFLGLLSSVRTTRLYMLGEQGVEQQLFLARTQMALVLAVLLTLVGDAVAMFRHLPQWTGHPATEELLLLFVGMVIFAGIDGTLVFISARKIGFLSRHHAWEKGIIIFVAMVGILAFYPENLISSNIGELFTVVIGALLLFAPLWALGDTLLPYTLEKQVQNRGQAQGKYQWIVVIFLGICIGLVIVLGESREGVAGIQFSVFIRHFYVVFVYVGLELSAVLIGYSFLRKQLGLYRA